MGSGRALTRTGRRSAPARTPRARSGPLSAGPSIDTLDAQRIDQRAVIETLADVIESRKPAASGHSARVAERSLAVLRALTDAEPSEDVRAGFVLHDVGLIGVPESVLLKAGPLDEDELAAVRGHPAAGVRLLTPLGLSRAALAVVHAHHERFDGTGYPKGIRGDRIPLAARVFAVVDAYDSMTNARPYRRPMDHACATAELRAKAGKQFDPACVDVFVRLGRALGLR